MPTHAHMYYTHPRPHTHSLSLSLSLCARAHTHTHTHTRTHARTHARLQIHSCNKGHLSCQFWVSPPADSRDIKERGQPRKTITAPWEVVLIMSSCPLSDGKEQKARGCRGGGGGGEKEREGERERENSRKLYFTRIVV